MLTAYNATFYATYIQSFAIAAKAWRDLAVAKDKAIKKGPGATPRLFEFVAEVNRLLDLIDKGENIAKVDLSLIRLLNSTDVANYLANPADPEAYSVVVQQVLFIASGLGLFPEAEPYGSKELYDFFNGDADNFSEEIFAATMRSIVRGENVEQMAPLVFAYLDLSKKMSDLTEKVDGDDWYTAAMQGLVLHAAWQWLPSAPPDTQDLLIGNYFFSALAAGVPCRDSLALALESAKDSQNEANFNQRAVKALEQNKEVVITQLPNSGQTLFNLVEKYLAQYGQNHSSGFSQQEFAQEIYKEQKHRDVLGLWLREAMAIYLHLKEGDINK